MAPPNNTGVLLLLAWGLLVAVLLVHVSGMLDDSSGPAGAFTMGDGYVPPECYNGVFDPEHETDVDCGKHCPPCQPGQNCVTDYDCVGFYACLDGVCGEREGCTELYPGHNNKSADRVNIVLIPLAYTSMNDFLWDAKVAIDLNSDYPDSGPGLMEFPVYRDNKDKFNFWYIDAIFDPDGDPAVSCTYCSNDTSKSYCLGMPNTYRANYCDLYFRSCAHLGGPSYNSPVLSWPKVFIHEFQHQFPKLADEYVESRMGDWPRQPNCAPDFWTAVAWWGDIAGQTSEGLTVGYYNGCSYVYGNFRPTYTSIMKTLSENRLGLVNTRHIESVLDEYSGLQSEAENHALVTLVGDPSDISTYKVKSIVHVSLSGKVKVKKDTKYKLTLTSGSKSFTQGFNTVDYLVIEDFSEDTIRGEIVAQPKETIEVFVPLGKAKFDKKTGELKITGKKDGKVKVNIGKREKNTSKTTSP